MDAIIVALMLYCARNQTGGGLYYYGNSLVAAVSNSSVPLDRLTDMAIRIMTLYYLLSQDHDFPTPDLSTGDEPGNNIVDVPCR